MPAALQPGHWQIQSYWRPISDPETPPAHRLRSLTAERRLFIRASTDDTMPIRIKSNAPVVSAEWDRVPPHSAIRASVAIGGRSCLNFWVCGTRGEQAANTSATRWTRRAKLLIS